ncbi:MAG: tol-pal system-associated acyl-CoA thioesterase [Pseudomonadota bacterium]|nr:MAG: tol-pal system-associated acyl-CoA thioesterase [Pseudomonadota bacterium]
MIGPFRYRVYWEDTDAGGVVYHARYLHFFERARSDWLRAMGYPQSALQERENRLFVVRRMRLDFIAPARLEDELAVVVGVEHLRAASLTFDQALLRGDDCLCRARVEVACLRASDFRPVRLPANLRTAIDGRLEPDETSTPNRKESRQQ